MTVRTFLLIGAGLGVVYGVGFVLAPGLMADLYGVKLTEAVAMMDRYFGVGLLGVGLLCWAVRDVTDPDLVSRVLLALGAANLVGIFVSLHATLTHAINGLGWFNVLLYVGLVGGCAYFLRRPTVAYRAG